MRPWRVRKFILNRVIVVEKVIVDTNDEKVTPKVDIVDTKGKDVAVVITN